MKVLDVDSEALDHFDETDKKYLEEIVAMIPLSPKGELSFLL